MSNSKHNEGHRRAAALMRSRPEYLALPKRLRQHLIFDICDTLATVVSGGSELARFTKKHDHEDYYE